MISLVYLIALLACGVTSYTSCPAIFSFVICFRCLLFQP